MSEDLNKDVVQLIDQIREKTEKFGADSAEVKSLTENHSKILEKQEQANQEIVAKMADAVKKQLDLEEQVKDLEVELARKMSSPKAGDYKETAEYKALNLFAAKGMDALNMEEKALLRTDSDTSGGYLTTSEMDSQIIKLITEISPVRQVARVRTVGKKTLEMPKRTGILSATYEGETESASDSTSTYGIETITANALTVNVPLTFDMLSSGDFDVENEVAQDVAEAFAQAEGNRFLVGDGVNKPEGVLANASVVSGAVETINSYAAEGKNTITGDDLILLIGELKRGYNPIFGFNRQTLAYLQTLKGGDGQYLWQGSLGAGAPNTIAGIPYAVMQDVPDRDGSGNLAVVLGDFARGYTIIDRTGLSVIRDDVTRKKHRIIELCFTKYNTGKVVLPEAFKALKIKA